MSLSERPMLSLLEEKALVRVIKSMVLILSNKIGLLIHYRKDLEGRESCLVPKRWVDQWLSEMAMN